MMGVFKRVAKEVSRQVNVKAAAKTLAKIRKEEITDKRKAGKEGKN